MSKVQVDRINMLRFEDDIAVMGKSEQELSKQLPVMDFEQEYNLIINVNKTNVMACNKHRQSNMNIPLNGKRVVEV